jgi:chitinase
MKTKRATTAAIAALATSAATLTGFALPASAASADVNVDWKITQDWGTGYQGTVTVKNTSTKNINPWSVTIPYANGITSTWDAVATSTTGGYRFSGPNWNLALAPGASVTFGFIGAAKGGALTPTSCVVSGSTCAVNNGTSTGTPALTPTVDPTVPPTPTPTPTTPAASASALKVSLKVTSDWGTGRNVDMVVTNTGTTTVNKWSVSVPWKGSSVSMWNASAFLAGGVLTATNLSWNGTLAPGASASLGFTDNGSFVLPTTCATTVGTCELNGAGVTPQPAPSETVTPTPTPTPTTDPTTPPVDPYVPSPDAYTGDKKIVAYYPSWATYARNYQVADIPGQKITHINFAFANIADGKCVVGDSYADTDKAFAGDSWDVGAKRGNFNQLTKLKAANPNLETMISIGGWTWSKNFSAAAATDASRKAFVSSCVDFMKTYNFDGIDIDWEYPVSGGLYAGTAADKANYTALLAEFKKELTAQTAIDGEHHPLTIAAPAGPTTIPNLEAKNIGGIVDWMNLMSYDYHGGWDSITGHNAPMKVGSKDAAQGFSISDSVDAYLTAGFPAQKLVLGLPLYGRGWENVNATGNGLYQSATNASVGTWEKGVFDYTDIKNNYLPTMTRYWDSEAQVPYLYDPARKLWISYDDPQSIKIKVDYIKAKGLGGAMLWELSGDRDEELLDVIGANLK